MVVSSVAWSGESTQIFSGSFDRTVRVYGATSVVLLAALMISRSWNIEGNRRESAQVFDLESMVLAVGTTPSGRATRGASGCVLT